MGKVTDKNKIIEMIKKEIEEKIYHKYEDHDLLDLSNINVICEDHSTNPLTYLIKIKVPAKNYNNVYSCNSFKTHYFVPGDISDESIIDSADRAISHFNNWIQKWYEGIDIAKDYINIDEESKSLSMNDEAYLCDLVEYTASKLLDPECFDLEDGIESNLYPVENTDNKFFGLIITMDRIERPFYFEHVLDFEANMDSFKIAFVEFIEHLTDMERKHG